MPKSKKQAEAAKGGNKPAATKNDGKKVDASAATQEPDAVLEQVPDRAHSAPPAAVLNDKKNNVVEEINREQTRGDKKNKKLLDGIDTAQVFGICRVVMVRPKDELIVIANPEIHRCKSTGAYFVFGDGVIQNGNAQPQLAAAKRMAKQRIEELNAQGKTLPSNLFQGAGNNNLLGAGNHDHGCGDGCNDHHGHSHSHDNGGGAVSAAQMRKTAKSSAPKFTEKDIEVVMDQSDVNMTLENFILKNKCRRLG